MNRTNYHMNNTAESMLLLFVNSEHHHDHAPSDDYLEQAAWVKKFCAAVGCSVRQFRTEHTELVVARDLMRDIIFSLMARASLTRAQLTALNRRLSNAPLRQQLAADEQGKLVLLSTPVGRVSIEARLLAAFADLLASDRVHRVKLCASASCRWAFIDQSRNKSRRWCSSSKCGNVHKVRAHRARQ